MCVEMPRNQIQSNNTSFIATYCYASALVKSLLVMTFHLAIPRHLLLHVQNCEKSVRNLQKKHVVSFYSVEIPKTSTRRKIRGFYNLWKKNQINDVLGP